MRKPLLVLITASVLLSSCASNTVMPREDLWKKAAEVNRDISTSGFEVTDRQNNTITARRLLVNDSNVVSWIDEMDSSRLMAEAKGFTYNYRMGGAVQGGIMGIGIGLAGSVLMGTSITSPSRVSETPDVSRLFAVVLVLPVTAAIGFGIGYLIGQPIHYSFPD